MIEGLYIMSVEDFIIVVKDPLPLPAVSIDESVYDRYADVYIRYRKGDFTWDEYEVCYRDVFGAEFDSLVRGLLERG